MAADLHIEAMAWLRYTKQMPLVCTEVGRWNADVLGIGPRYSIEVEVKKTIADLRADFRGKKAKHYAYQNVGVDRWVREVPNYLYYIVPETLREKALNVIEQNSPLYGLLWVPTMSFGKETSSLGYTAGKNVQVGKKAGKLHGDKPQETTVWTVIRRLSSELVGLYQRHLQLEVNLKDTLDKVRQDIRLSAAIVAGNVPEPPDEYEETQGETLQPHQNPPE